MPTVPNDSNRIPRDESLLAQMGADMAAVEAQPQQVGERALAELDEAHLAHAVSAWVSKEFGDVAGPAIDGGANLAGALGFFNFDDQTRSSTKRLLRNLRKDSRIRLAEALLQSLRDQEMFPDLGIRAFQQGVAEAEAQHEREMRDMQ